MVKVIRAESREFEIFFRQLRERGQVFDAELTAMVADVVEDVRLRGDEALFAYTARWDKHPVNAATVEVSREEWRETAGRVDTDTIALLQLAASRIEKFHEKQRMESWSVSDEEGVELGQMVIPLERVGIYAPGGLASYPSTVLMTAIPARIAGVREIILTTPCPGGELSPHIAAAAEIAGVTRIFRIGGAQAVAALAYGTESIPRVDKIVGPGNRYVAAAKKRVFGQVAIDMIAGPSEVLVIADKTGNAAWAAADMLAQAEHDENAGAVLMTPDETFADAVAGEIKRQLDNLERSAIASRSLERYGAVIITRDLDQAIGLANEFAPEHLELMVENPQATLPLIRNAGAVFMGKNTPEALGDYMAGPNHVLPTGGTARFASPLGVYDFYKRTSVLAFSGEALKGYGEPTARFADLEGLYGHARSVRERLKA